MPTSRKYSTVEEESGNPFFGGGTAAAAATRRSAANSSASGSIVAFTSSKGNSNKKNDDDDACSVLSVYTPSPRKSAPKQKSPLLLGGGDDGSLSLSLFSSVEKASSSSNVASKKIRLSNENWSVGNTASFSAGSPSILLPGNKSSRLPTSTKAIPALPTGAAIAAPRPRHREQSYVELNYGVIRRASTARTDKKKSNRTKAAAAFDKNKAERKACLSSAVDAHEVLSVSVQVGDYIPVSVLGPKVDPAFLVGKGETPWYSLNEGQKAVERQNSHKRNLKVNLSSIRRHQITAGWVERYNNRENANFSLFGISDEEVRAGAEMGIKCMNCMLVLPESIGLGDSFTNALQRTDETRGGHPLRKHLMRCGSKSCDRCGVSIEEYVSLRGSDKGWGTHATHCKKWHENLEGLKQFQKDRGTWNWSSRRTKELTSAEKKIFVWKQSQRSTNIKQYHTEHQKKMLAVNFPGWYDK